MGEREVCEEGHLCLTPSSRFLVVDFVSSEGVSPAVADSERHWLDLLLASSTLAELFTHTVEVLHILSRGGLPYPPIREFFLLQIFH